MTRDEHVTRAMLLGRTYDSRTNTYADWRNYVGRFLDADTLEVIEHEAFRSRLMLFFDQTDKKAADIYRMNNEAIAALGG